MTQKNNNHIISLVVIVFLLVTVMALFTINTMNVYVINMAVLTAFTAVVLIFDGRTRFALLQSQNKGFLVWFALFFVFIEIHYSYIHWDSFSFVRRMRIWLPTLLVIVWLSKVKNSDLLEFFGKCCAIASIPILLLLLTSTGISTVYQGERFSEADIGLNGNTIALYMLFLIFFSLILSRTKTKRSTLLFYLTAVLTFVIFITGCRRAIIGVILLYMSYFLLFSQKHRVRSLSMAAIVLIVIVYLLLNVNFLYDIAGNRIERLFFNMGFIDSLGGAETYDYSTEVRGEIIPIAFMMFYASPLLGNGYAYFITHSGLNTIAQGFSTHNNYLEILVSYGILGFVLYYSLIFYIVYKLIKNWKCNCMVRFILAFMLIHLIVIEPTTVNYSSYVIFYILYYIIFRIAKSKKQVLQSI